MHKIQIQTYRFQAVGYQRGGLAVGFREVVGEALVLTLLAAQLHELALDQVGQNLQNALARKEKNAR